MSANMVTRGNTVADIGCDHAYTSVYLCREGISPHVVAADVREGPLKHARINVGAYGLTDKIDVRLSDGLTKLMPGEADTILITGMGGLLMCEILEKGKNVADSAKEFVLQPQSDIPKFRHFLHDNGFKIIDEDMTLDAGKYYVSIHAVHADKPEKYDEDFLYEYGILAYSGKKVFFDFLEKEELKYKKTIEAIKNAGAENQKKRLEEITHSIEMINAARNAAKGI